MKIEQNEIKISPSILAADLSDLKQQLQGMDPDMIDFIHLDIMDGHFVPTLSFGEAYVKSLSQHTNIPLDVHLMVADPENNVPKYFPFRPHNISFHIEATNFPIRLSRLIRSEDILAGVVLNPGTSLQLLEPLLDEIDFILLMSVEPGFYGQRFIPQVLDKLRKLKSMIADRNILIEIDGGVGPENIAEVFKAGADIAVCGSSAFSDGNLHENVRKMKQLTNSIDRQKV